MENSQDENNISKLCFLAIPLKKKALAMLHCFMMTLCLHFSLLFAFELLTEIQIQYEWQGASASKTLNIFEASSFYAEKYIKTSTKWPKTDHTLFFGVINRLIVILIIFPKIHPNDQNRRNYSADNTHNTNKCSMHSPGYKMYNYNSKLYYAAVYKSGRGVHSMNFILTFGK